jgi:hypothetical protein
MAWIPIAIGALLAIGAILNIIFRRKSTTLQNRYRPRQVAARTTTKVIGSSIILAIAAFLILGGIAEIVEHSTR